ncbi:MAG: hypothetical protein EH224_10555 [Calditrichaeota bacterium]|nr:MAG: hypothetical protein EH224_10555 [Calditrichota bacterium]
MEVRFKKDFLSKIELAGKTSWLEQNNLGAYASSTLAGMNTRREHGLYCIPLNNAKERMILLSKLEESVFIDNHLYEISTNQYSNNIFPEGYKYLHEAIIYPIPQFTFLIDGQKLRKTVLLMSDQNILVVRYELCNQGKPFNLVIKPFLSIRSNQELLTNIQGFNTDSYKGNNFVRWVPRDKLPGLNANFSKGEFISSTLWYHKFFYEEDVLNHDKYTEDLFNPGFFNITLEPYETVEISFSIEDFGYYNLDFDELYRKETESRKKYSCPEFISEDKFFWIGRAIRNSQIRHNNKKITIFSNFEFRPSMREFLLAMPGFYLSMGRWNDFKNIVDDLLNRLDRGLLPDWYLFDTENSPYSSPDLSLWLIINIHHYLENTGDVEFLTKDRLEKIKSIIEEYQKGTLLNIYMDRDGLLFCGDNNMDINWLSNFKPFHPGHRFGKLLHMNALWYASLMTLENIYKKLDKKRIANKYESMAELTKNSFRKKFINADKNQFFEIISEKNYLKKPTLSQILPFALPFNPVSQKHKEVLFANLVGLLVSSRGMRPEVADENSNSDGVYWPWANMLYFQALINLEYPKTALLEKYQTYQNKMLAVISEGVLGTIPEAIMTKKDKQIYTGAPDFGLSIAAFLWISYLVSKV